MLFYVRRHTGADDSFEWFVLNGPYEAAREQILSDESGGCSGAGEVAGAARSCQVKSAQASAEGSRTNDPPAKITHQGLH
jgi:hypothetical protein